MGVINQLGKFTTNIADLLTPLRKLLSNKQAWLWGPTQEESYKKLKVELTQPTVLKLYDTHAVSKYQQTPHPMALERYCSNSLTNSGFLLHLPYM